MLNLASYRQITDYKQNYFSLFLLAIYLAF